MNDVALHEAVRGLYRIQQLGMLDELRRWIAAAMKETPPSGMRDAAWLDVAIFADDVAGLLGLPKERVLKAACAELLPSPERIVLEEIRAFLRWIDGEDAAEPQQPIGEETATAPRGRLRIIREGA